MRTGSGADHDPASSTPTFTTLTHTGALSAPILRWSRRKRISCQTMATDDESAKQQRSGW